MKNFLLIFTSLVFISSLNSQNKANDFYEASYFKEASIIFEKELSKDRDDSESLRLKLADCYYHMNDFKNSIKIYDDLYKNKNKNKDSLTLVRLAELNRMFGKYDEAEKYFSVYAENHIIGPEDKLKFDRMIESKILYPKTNSELNNLVELNNLKLPKVKQGTGYTFMDNGDLLGGIEQESKETKTAFTTLGIFSSASDFQSVEEFKFRSKTNCFNGYPSYNKSSNILYFTASISKRKKSFKETKNVLQVFSLNIASSKNEPELLSFNQPNYSFTHPSISKDGNRLYFVSDMPGGYGGFDVYYVEKTEDGWSDIKNCGNNVNTSFDEQTPFVSGDSLYFSSYGHENYGGYDIFLSLKKGEVFSKASNLGLPVNSCMNDFAFIMTPEAGNGILTSDRNFDESNKDDVYSVLFSLAPNTITNKLSNAPIADVFVTFGDGEETLFDDAGEWAKRISLGDSISIKFENPYYETKILEYAKVSNSDLEEIKNVTLSPIMIPGRFINDITGYSIEGVTITLYEKVGDDEWKFVEVKKSDNDGELAFHVRKDRDHKVVQEKEYYISHSEIIPRYVDSKELRNEALTRMNPFSLKYNVEKDMVIEIDNIYFDFNSSLLRKESFPILDKVKDLLDDNSEIRIELSAHTDCIGTDKYNLLLSKRRAERSRKYLIEKGISPDRIISRGYGEQLMIVKDCELQKKDDSEAQKNRRVEFKML